MMDYFLVALQIWLPYLSFFSSVDDEEQITDETLLKPEALILQIYLHIGQIMWDNVRKLLKVEHYFVFPDQNK